MNREILDKLESLKEYLGNLGSVAIAFSGGVDSTFLLKVAHDVLGENTIAIMLKAKAFPSGELAEAQSFCEDEGIKYYVCEFEPLNIHGFADNPPDRCYICKKKIFNEIIQIAKEHGVDNVAEGSNMDDISDYRPGLRAINELNVFSPLQKAELSKDEIRMLSRQLGLSTWKKPSKACLASRFVYGEKITKEKLQMIDRAEQFLMEHGFEQNRVRIHGMMARIEILPKQFDKFMEDNIREEIYNYFKYLGFSYITLDILGFRSGSMNEELLWKK